MIKTPPLSDMESPMVAAVTSKRCPDFAKGGRVAVSQTAARLRPAMSALSRLIPIRSRALMIGFLESRLSAESPVPSKPTTMPKPINWLSRAPRSDAMSFTLTAHKSMGSRNKSIRIRSLKIIFFE